MTAMVQAFTHYAMPEPLGERRMKKLWKEPSHKVVLAQEDFSWMHPTEPVIPEGAVPKLSGWVSKMHRSSRRYGRRWGSRFLDVDDYRGRVSLAKSRQDKPRTVCPLQDVVLAVAEAPLAHAFVIKCGGIDITVCASSQDELGMWLSNLQARIDEWKKKTRHEGPPEARPAFGSAGEDIYWLRRAMDGTFRALW